MKLYDYGASANCLKVRILLRLLGVEHERVPVDIFAGESQTAEHLARNPAGRTPVLELDSGETIPESNAILLHLARRSDLLPADPVAEARVLGWLFFEQNLVEPNVGGARFWRLTGRDAGREEVVARFHEAGSAALDILERHLDGRAWLVGDTPSVADVGLYAYVHVAPDGGVLVGRPAGGAGVASPGRGAARVRERPGAVSARRARRRGRAVSHTARSGRAGATAAPRLRNRWAGRRSRPTRRSRSAGRRRSSGRSSCPRRRGKCRRGRRTRRPVESQRT